MNLLVIINNIEEIELRPSLLKGKSIKKIWLLCLSPRARAHHYKQVLEDYVKREIQVQIINPKELVDFDHLQKILLEYLAQLPERLKVSGVSLSDFMVVQGANLWWASKTVEATAYKSKTFPNFYYLSAVRAALGNLDVTDVWVQVDNLMMEKDLKILLNKFSVKYTILSGNFDLSKIISQLYLRMFGRLGPGLVPVKEDNLLTSVLSFFLHLAATVIFKSVWPAWARPGPSLPGQKSIHLFYSNYPKNIHMADDKTINKVYGEIPLTLEKKMGGKAFYFAFFPPSGLMRIGSLITNILRFWRHRFALFPIHLFLSVRDIIKIFLLSEGRRKYKILKNNQDYLSAFNLEGIDLFHTFDQEIKESLTGKGAHETLLHFYAFRRFVETHGENTSQIIYYSEFHNWEVALLDGVRAADTFVPVIGLQQSAPNPILLSSIFSPSIFLNKDYAYPLPDLIASSGEFYKEMLLSSGIKAEKIEVIGLIEDLYAQQPELSENAKNIIKMDLNLPLDSKICLVACSIDLVITKGILYLLSRVIPHCPEVYFLIKGHPIIPIPGLMKKYNIESLENVKTTSHPMSVVLPLADYFLSSSTSTSLEAMSLGIAQANLDVGGLPKANPLHLIPNLIKDLETPEDLMEFVEYPERFQITREHANLYFGDAIPDPTERFAMAIISKFHANVGYK